MLKKDEIEKEGIVLENLPNTLFRVQANEGGNFLCMLSGKMRIAHIRILPGDKVKFIVTPYDKNRGRIVYRMK